MNLQEGGEAFSFMSRIARTISRLIQTNEIFGRNLPALIESAMDVHRYPDSTDGLPERIRDDQVFLRAISTVAGLGEQEEAIAWFTFWLGFDPSDREKKFRMIRSAARHFGCEVMSEEECDDWLAECGRAAFLTLGWDQWCPVVPMAWHKGHKV